MFPKIKIRQLALTIALLIISTACNSGEPGTGGAAVTIKGGDGGAATSGNSAAAISADDKPLDVLTKAMRGQLDAKSYRAHVTMESGGVTNKMVIEYAAPDRYRMVNDGQAAGRAMRQEFVIVGGAAYLKAPGGQWVKSPIDAGALVKQFRDPKMLEELAKTSDVKFVGPDVLDGVPTLVYQYTQNNPLGMNLKSTAKTWLAVADGLPRKSESEGEYNGVKTKTLMTITDYNTDIKIDAPVK